MQHKRSRTPEEKIADALDTKVRNLHPEIREQLFQELLKIPDININVGKCIRFVSKKLSLPEMGPKTSLYWQARGWSPEMSYVNAKKTKQDRPRKGKSPFSRGFWLEKINPLTNKQYTIEEADYERNSMRPIRKEYWLKKGYSEEEAIQKATQTKTNNNNKGALAAGNIDPEIRKITSKRCLEFWISQGYSDIEAKEQVSMQQATFSLDICIEKYGKKKGQERWLERQAQWQKNFKKSNFSKVSQELFWNIVNHLTDLTFIHFAELSPEKEPDLSGKNNEIRLKLDSVVLPDFIDTQQKKIIEFDGTYWHGRTGHGNKSREIKRNEILKKHRYDVIHINETFYCQNKEQTISQCLTFLAQ